MEAITQIMDAMKAALVEEWPTIPVVIKAAPAARGEKPVLPGWTPGSAVPCFCLSSLDPETIDTSGSFENVSITNPVVVEWVRSGAPRNYPDDPDTREKRMRLMEMFYQSSIDGFPSSVFDSRYTPLPVYSGNEAGDVVISAQIFAFTFVTERPGAA